MKPQWPDLGIVRRQQMRAAQDKMYRLGCRTLRRFDNLFDGWMTAPHNKDDPVGRVDRQRDFLHFQVHTQEPFNSMR